AAAARPVPSTVERKPPPVAAPSADAVASLRALALRSPSPAAAPPARAATSASAPQAPPSAAPGDQVTTLGTGSGGVGGGGPRGGRGGTGDRSGRDGGAAATGAMRWHVPRTGPIRSRPTRWQRAGWASRAW